MIKKTTYSNYTNHTFWFLDIKVWMNLEKYLDVRNVFLKNKV